MWGNARGAAELSPEHPLATLLFKTTGPAPVPLNSQQWTSLLLHYPILVHLDPQSNVLVKTVCNAMARHAVASSNLAVLSIHVARMVRDLLSSASDGANGDGGGGEELVGKVRATCGCLNLLRVLCHAVIEAVCRAPKNVTQGEEEGKEVISLGVSEVLEEIFTYREENGERRDAAKELLSALLPFLTLPHPQPAVYDATNLSLSLVLVLLSTQLYQPMVSSSELSSGVSDIPVSNRGYNFFLDRIVSHGENWARDFITVTLRWFVDRPVAPPKSLALRHYQLTQGLINAKGEIPRDDGLYDNHYIVPATAAKRVVEDNDEIGEKEESLLVGATKGMLTISSAIILLPFRLLHLAMSTIGLLGDGSKSDTSTALGNNNVMWLSDSPVADMGICVLLLLTHNHCKGNAWRETLKSLKDVRWDDTSNGGGEALAQQQSSNHNRVAINFETLFDAFGKTLHTELGALLLYTLLQSSPSFAASMAVRSDLDTLVVPLVRTLYFSSAVPIMDKNVKGVIQHPFRSQSQLYVILILLLLFSQDNSFGPDAFRRVFLENLPWYHERQLKDISLGSVVLLTLLRCLTYNVNRLRDGFLMSNCCAILMNLSPNMVNLHSYSAMRLCGVTVSCMKRYVVAKKAGDEQNEIAEMFGEASRTLLQILRTCLQMDRIEKNIQVLYALAYLKRDFDEIVSSSTCPFTPSEIGFLSAILTHTDTIIQKDGEALTATQAMYRLTTSIEDLKSAMRTNTLLNNDAADAEGDFTFTYEEDADPEVFFVPYIWDVVTCAVTVSFVEWDKAGIKVYAKEEEEAETVVEVGVGGDFSKDVIDVV